jgi:cytochrome c
MTLFTRRIALAAGATAYLLAGPSFGQSSDRGTPQEAKAMVEAAVAHIKSAGADKAFADFHVAGSKWLVKDLYVFSAKFNGDYLALGANPKIVGKNMMEVKTADGKPFVKEMSELAQKGGGWYEYMWQDPLTKKVNPKVSFIQRVPGMDAYIGVGVYKPE